MDWIDPARLYASFFGSDVIVAPEYLLVAAVIAYALYRWRRPEGGFWAWLMPRAIYLHPSHMLDLKLFALGRLITFFGLFNKIAVTTVIAAAIAGTQDAPSREINPWLMAAAIFVLSDFILYWVHRVHHETRILWPLHALHHSAEVLTPVTAYRQHPLASVLVTVVQGAVFGVAQGMLLLALGAEFTGAQIAGVNSFFFILAMLTANFRHSHIWVSFGPVWERILISPAQHQIHHSREPRHHNKNYGENLAIWDWMFGTLYVPQGEEDFALGIADADGRALEQRHGSLAAALIVPITDTIEALRPRARPKR
ncbi:sterol desaturase/sphingolipid hydroxylase (fatty acid hydroxylase superfamily) [Litoreibacter ponti]|uniref:Sterol desaturase/sphingolipid hydroxylase (Fatty acid hydroxylase superfamily) n=1 Tax=Litoreibacter ponti TaxID=1510457 RepID=A0A2T6BI42_9RHOB|nr:sterol desaturase family protein [Litoreibacter ponti]PTX55716.1 sterol desaturase/sphingolipid hydroxylase (fatty acid hydroxylase superfamily) [Litoreibacter ponti]